MFTINLRQQVFVAIVTASVRHQFVIRNHQGEIRYQHLQGDLGTLEPIHSRRASQTSDLLPATGPYIHRVQI